MGMPTPSPAARCGFLFSLGGAGRADAVGVSVRELELENVRKEDNCGELDSDPELESGLVWESEDAVMVGLFDSLVSVGVIRMCGSEVKTRLRDCVFFDARAVVVIDAVRVSISTGPGKYVMIPVLVPRTVSGGAAGAEVVVP